LIWLVYGETDGLKLAVKSCLFFRDYKIRSVLPGFLTNSEKNGVKTAKMHIWQAFQQLQGMTQLAERSIPKQFKFEQPKSPPVVVNFQGGQVTQHLEL
jgi:hypothetical protein